LHEQFTYLKSSIGTFLKLLTHDAKRLSKRSKYHTVKPGHSRDYFCDIAARQKVSSDSIHKLFLSACIKSSPSTKTEDPYKGILLQEHLVFPILNFLINICQININVQTCRKTPSYSSGWSALHFSVYNNNFELIKILLDSGADIFLKNKRGDSALSLLADRHKDNDSILKILEMFENSESWKFSNYKKELRENYQILLKAVEKNNTALIKWLIKSGVNVDNRYENVDGDGDFDGYVQDTGQHRLETALTVAIRSDMVYSTAVAKVLIDCGANVNLDYDEGPPLYKAILTGNTNKIKLLIENGADINYRSNNVESLGLTCLQMAKFCVDPEETEFLNYLEKL